MSIEDGPSLRASDRRVIGLIAALGVVLCLRYATAGPGFFLDDWFALRNGRLLDWWDAAGPEQWRARPGAGGVYAIAFGLVGGRPLVFFVAAMVLMVASAMLLYRLSSRWLPTTPAAALAIVWLALPNHTSLEMWPSALNITLALALALGGALVASRPEPSTTSDISAGVLLLASILCYEATAPAAAAFIAVLAWRRTGSARSRLLVAGWGPLALGGLWMLLHWHPGKQGLNRWIRPADIVPAHIGSSVFGLSAVGDVLGLLVLVLVAGVGACALLPDRRHLLDWEGKAMAAGWLLVLLGALPFVRYFYSPLGLGDRVTVVSGIGGALVLVAGFGFAIRNARPIGVGLAVLAVAAAAMFRADMTESYATAADDSRRILDSVEQRWPTPPAEPIVFGPYPVVDRNVIAFIDADWPLQYLYGTYDVRARTTFETEDFEAVDPSLRVDIVELSNLDSERRLYPG